MKRLNHGKLSQKALSFLNFVEALADTNEIKLNFYELPATYEGGWGYQKFNGTTEIDVCVVNINDQSVFEVNLIHELIHTRHTLFGFPAIVVDKKAPSEIKKQISNFGSFVGHLELYPYLSMLGFSNDYFFKHNCNRLMDEKDALINDFYDLDKLNNNPALEASQTINLLEIYLFANHEMKGIIKGLSGNIRKKCEMWERKLVIGFVRDDYLSEKDGSNREITIEIYLKNIDRLRNILGLNDYIKVLFNNAIL